LALLGPVVALPGEGLWMLELAELLVDLFLGSFAGCG